MPYVAPVARKESMNAEQEMMDYLESLLQHRKACDDEACSSCSTLQGICDLIRKQIFAGPIYPEVPVSMAQHC